MKHVLSATKARNNFFEILNAVIFKGEEYVVEKEHAGRVRIVPEVQKRPTAEEIEKTLAELRRVFGRYKRKKYWSVLDTPAWKKKERKYLENLSKGIIT